jgi:lipoyl(octanoyl) transferase
VAVPLGAGGKLTGPVRTVTDVPQLRIVRAGLVRYETAWELQRALHAERVAGVGADTVLLLEHPSVFTAGRRTAASERPTDGTPVIDVDRGGKITWHGPGQLVGYPILRLPDPIDVVAYMRRLEQMLMAVCAQFGVATAQVAGRTGVWVLGGGGTPDRKIAALGVRIARGVSLHGFAVNCDPDLRWFERIVPCGIADADVTSLSRELGWDVPVADVIPVVERHLSALTASPAAAAVA